MQNLGTQEPSDQQRRPLMTSVQESPANGRYIGQHLLLDICRSTPQVPETLRIWPAEEFTGDRKEWCIQKCSKRETTLTILKIVGLHLLFSCGGTRRLMVNWVISETNGPLVLVQEGRLDPQAAHCREGSGRFKCTGGFHLQWKTSVLH